MNKRDVLIKEIIKAYRNAKMEETLKFYKDIDWSTLINRILERQYGDKRLDARTRESLRCRDKEHSNMLFVEYTNNKDWNDMRQIDYMNGRELDIPIDHLSCKKNDDIKWELIKMYKRLYRGVPCPMKQPAVKVSL